jgi:CheY-like chemotaxis protein
MPRITSPMTFMTKAPQTKGSARLETPAPTNRARILYADDESALRLCVSRYLSRVGYAVTTVENGYQAWVTLQSLPCDLLITDQEMPGLTGRELILRTRLLGLSLPIIVATSDSEFLTDSCDRQLQIAAVLQKPFGLGELSDAVGQALCAGHDVYRGSPNYLGFRLGTVDSHLQNISLEASSLDQGGHNDACEQSGPTANQPDSYPTSFHRVLHGPYEHTT